MSLLVRCMRGEESLLQSVLRQRLAPLAVSRPFASWSRPILTEIYLCHACSCQEIMRATTAEQAALSADGSADPSLARLRAIKPAAAWRQVCV
eukprot:COSAG01_NODE_227_length_21107_cov_85.615099_21_plen_93_part_00